MSGPTSRRRQQQLLPHEGDGLTDSVNHLVECGNNWIRASRLSKLENYFSGQIKFVFENVGCRNDGITQLIGRDNPVAGPFEFAFVFGERDGIDIHHWPIGNKLAESLGLDVCLVYRWDQQSVLV